MIEQLSVVIADGIPIFSLGVANVLKRRKKFTVAGIANTSRDVIVTCSRVAPSVLLLDLDLTDGGALDAASRIKSNVPATKILFTSLSERETDIVEAFNVGGDGYVLKTIEVNDLLMALTLVNRGATYIDHNLAARRLRHLSQPKENDTVGELSDLSPREVQVLESVARGMTNKEIARHLSLAEKTIKHYLTKVMQKLNVRNRVEAAVVARAKLERRPLDERRAGKQLHFLARQPNGHDDDNMATSDVSQSS